MKVKDYLLNRDKYAIDSTYQRPADVWSKKDKQCFIDTIIRGEPAPILFINFDSKNGINYIVDGQQRLGCISDFYDNKFPLTKEFSLETLDGEKYKDLDTKNREKFLNYNLQVKIMQDYDDERIRMIFSRLQRGKPLYLGEKLNAKPGKIVIAMRELAQHPFMEKSIGVNKQRYRVYEDVARILFYEKYGPKECGANQIDELFERYKDDITIDSKLVKKVQSVFRFLLKCFPEKPGNYQFLSKHAWILTVYSAISDLKDSYVLSGHEQEIARFVEGFHGRVYSEDWRQSNIQIQRFYDNTRGGWAERLNTFRRDTLKEYMIRELNLRKLDENRQISDEDKIQAYTKVGGRCERCNLKFKDYKEAEYHHVEMYSEGGPSKLENIMVLCKSCHDDIHRTKAVDIGASRNDDEESEDI